MRRKLFNFATVLSLLLCVGIAILWIRTFQTPAYVYLSRPGGNLYAIGGHRGGVYLGSIGPWPCGECRLAYDTLPSITMQNHQTWNYGLRITSTSFSGVVAVGTDGQVSWGSVVPRPVLAGPLVKGVSVGARAGMLVTVLAFLPGAWFVLRIVRSRRRREGECRRCRYSLTGNTSGVCPECGTTIEQKAGAGA